MRRMWRRLAGWAFTLVVLVALWQLIPHTIYGATTQILAWAQVGAVYARAWTAEFIAAVQSGLGG